MPEDKKPTAKTRLTDVNVIEIAFAGTPAVPRATFALLKSLTDDTGRVPVIKSCVFGKDIEKRQVFGYILVPDEPDWQGDVISKDEIEKAAHSLLENLSKGRARGQGATENHIRITDSQGNDLGYIIESVIDKDGAVAKTHGLAGVDGAWWLGMQVESVETWGKIEKGEITGFSMGGSGVRQPIDGTEATEKSLLGRVWVMLKDAVTFGEADAQRVARDEMWQKMSTLQSVIFSILDDDAVTEKRSAIMAAIDDFKQSLVAALALEKVGREISATNMKLLDEVVTSVENLRSLLDRIRGKQEKSHTQPGDDDMSTEQLAQVTSKLDSILTKVSDLDTRMKALEQPPAEQPPAGDPPAAPPADTKNDQQQPPADDPVTKVLEKVSAIETSVTDLTKRIEKMETRPGQRNGSSDAPDPALDGADQALKDKASKVAKGIVGLLGGQ